MSLRPRYSLLMLFVITALVACGVKYWHGPHHVVEKNKIGEELTYSYTCDWRGERTIHGPYVRRNVRKSNVSSTHETNIEFYRSGIPLSWQYALVADINPPPGLSYEEVKFSAGLGLSKEEQMDWKNAIELEQERLSAQGYAPYGHWWKPWTAKETQERMQELRSMLPPDAQIWRP